MCSLNIKLQANIVEFSAQLINQISNSDSEDGKSFAGDDSVLRWKHREFSARQNSCVRTTRRVKCVNFLFHENVRVDSY